MIDTPTDTAAPPSPEIADVERRLAALPPAWVSDALRADALRAARGEAFGRQARERLAAAREAVQSATAALDGPMLTLAAAQVLSAERALESVPAVPQVNVAGAVNAARDELAVGLRAIPEDQQLVLAATLEVAAWRSWPAPWRSLPPPISPPIVLPAEAALIERITLWTAEVAGVRKACAYWTGAGAQGGILDALEAIGMLLGTVRDLAGLGAELVDEAEATNTQREAAGLSWDAAPASIHFSGQIASPVILRLTAWRSAREQRREGVPG
jgi:hypothetical protein